MNQRQRVYFVNRLLEEESTSLLQRAAESWSFIRTDVGQELLAMREMVSAEQDNQRKLIDLLDQLEATPGPRPVVCSTANLHFNRLDVLLPRLIADKERLIHAYDHAAEAFADDPLVADVVSAILSRHRAQLETLRQLNTLADA